MNVIVYIYWTITVFDLSLIKMSYYECKARVFDCNALYQHTLMPSFLIRDAIKQNES